MLSFTLMQKRGIAVQAIARELMPLFKGDKVPTVTQLSKKTGVSRGNVQYALENLRTHGAVKLLTRGHLGTFLEDINYIRLAQVCDIRSVVGVMPLPYSKQYEGLATGLFSALNEGNIEGNIAFMRGSGNRLKQLLSGRYDFAVMSCLAYEQYLNQGENITQVMEFPPGSFVNRHVVMVGSNFDGKWADKRVGIDYSSLDQKLLTLSYFKDKEVELVPLIYSQILQFLLDGSIDAGVWNIDDIELNTNDISILEIENHTIGSKNTQASIVCRAGDTANFRLLSELLDKEKIILQQMQVVREEIVPQY